MSPPPLNSIKLEEIASGNKDVFDAMFSHYYPKLMGYCRFILDENSAEDVVQDTFLYIWEKRASISFGDGFQAYLFQISYSRAIDFIRKKKRSRQLAGNENDKLLEEELSWLVNHNEDIVAQMTQSNILSVIDSLVETLPESRKVVFKMAYYEELKMKEIAEKTNLPLRTVESHIYLTIKFLRSKLQAEQLLQLFTFFLLGMNGRI